MRHLEAMLIAKAEHTGMLPKFDVDVRLENNKKGRVHLRRSLEENVYVLEPCVCFFS